MKGNSLIYVTVLVSIVTYLFWDVIKQETGIGVFYIGNALSVFIMALLIHLNNDKNFGSFYLLCITFQNLLDELIFNPLIISVSEITFALILPIIWLIKTHKLCLINWFNRNFRNSL